MTKGDKIKLRAELAGKAMQGIISSPREMHMVHKQKDYSGDRVELIVAGWAYLYADALMAELGIKGEE